MRDDVLDAFLGRGLAAQKAVDELVDVRVVKVKAAIDLLVLAANENRAGNPKVSYLLGEATGLLVRALRALGQPP